MIDYRTEFKLSHPVNNLAAASAYLESDDMTVYLTNDLLDDGRDTDESVTKIAWVLQTPNSGEIILTCKKSLSEGDLGFISDWVRGQNSDGLGEGFEQQDFAEQPDGSCSRFDWDTNFYEFG